MKPTKGGGIVLGSGGTARLEAWVRGEGGGVGGQRRRNLSIYPALWENFRSGGMTYQNQGTSSGAGKLGQLAEKS